MSLSEGKMKEIMEKIRPFIKNCPLCGHPSLTLEDNIFIYPGLEKKSVDLTKGYPVILVDCNNCYYTFSFNALRLGVVEK